MDDYIKCELSSVGYPRLFLKIFHLFIVAVHYTYKHMLCIVALVVSHVVHYKRIRIYHSLLLY